MSAVLGRDNEGFGRPGSGQAGPKPIAEGDAQRAVAFDADGIEIASTTFEVTSSGAVRK